VTVGSDNTGGDASGALGDGGDAIGGGASTGAASGGTSVSGNTSANPTNGGGNVAGNGGNADASAGATTDDAIAGAGGTATGAAGTGGAGGNGGNGANGGDAYTGNAVAGNGGNAFSYAYVIVDPSFVPQFNLGGSASDTGFDGTGPNLVGDPGNVPTPVVVPGIGGAGGGGTITPPKHGGGPAGKPMHGGGYGHSVKAAAVGGAAEVAEVKSLPAAGAGISGPSDEANLVMAGGLLAMMGAAFATWKRKFR
jgi:hypothetical protein